MGWNWPKMSLLSTEDRMTQLKIFAAAAVLATLAMLPNQAQARRHHHVHAHGLPYPISYIHNYGPGPEPGTFAFYDGPSTNACYRGASSYRGEDGQRHPCF
jgi:hypothetical protein